MAGGMSIELFLDRRAPERGELGIRVTLLSADLEIVFCGPGEVTGTSEGVSSNVSWTPVMNWRIVPLLNKLDQEPRDEFEDDTDGAKGSGLGEVTRAHVDVIGLVGLLDFAKLK
jgi:hypothetical protein